MGWINLPGVSMTLERWVNDSNILGNDQPFFKGLKETPGTHQKGVSLAIFFATRF